MRDPDWSAFIKLLPLAPLRARDYDWRSEFQARFGIEIFSLLDSLRHLKVIGGPTSLHPSPPDACDLCQAPLSEHRWMIDGQTVSSEWANMCPACYSKHGTGIGYGIGQLYLNLGDGNWRLVGGNDPEFSENGNG